MPRYTIEFEEHYIHKLQVEIDADDEYSAYQKVYQEDYNVSEPTLNDIVLNSKRVMNKEGVIVVPNNYNGPFM
jgi:hypothetical protein